MPDLFTRFGGHRQAAGLGLPASRVPEFRQRLNAYASARLTPADFRPQLSIDALVDLKDLTDRPRCIRVALHGAFRFRKFSSRARHPGRAGRLRACLDEGKDLRLHLRYTGRRPFPLGRTS